MRTIVKVSIVLICVGLLVCFIALCTVGFNVLAFDKTKYVEVTKTAESTEINKIVLNINNGDIIIKPFDGDKIEIVYFENENTDDPFYKYSENNGTISIVYTKIFWFDFGFRNLKDMTVNISVPKDGIFTLDLKTSNGKIQAENIKGKNIKLKTSNGSVSATNIIADNLEMKSSNGKMAAVNLEISDTLTIRTSNDSIEINDCRAANLIFLKTSNGKIYGNNNIAKTFDADTSNGNITYSNLAADFIKLKSSNGDISCEILGDYDDYKITSKTSNGKSNVGNTPSGVSRTKDVNLKTSNGNIELTFKKLN